MFTEFWSINRKGDHLGDLGLREMVELRKCSSRALMGLGSLIDISGHRNRPLISVKALSAISSRLHMYHPYTEWAKSMYTVIAVIMYYILYTHFWPTLYLLLRCLVQRFFLGLCCLKEPPKSEAFSDSF